MKIWRAIQLLLKGWRPKGGWFPTDWERPGTTVNLWYSDPPEYMEGLSGGTGWRVQVSGRTFIKTHDHILDAADVAEGIALKNKTPPPIT